jgi:hypothetical protein
MSALDGRLDKLMPALSAKERFLLELQSYKEGEKPNSAVRKTTPDDQTAEFNYYIRLFNKVNRKLGAYTIVVRLLVEKLLGTTSLMLSTCDLGFQVWELAKLVPPAKRAKAEAIVRDSIHPVELPWQEEDKPDSWLNQAESLVVAVRRDLYSRWQEVLAIDAVLDEIAEDFDGEDLALPELREWLAEAKKNLELIGRLLNEEKPALVLGGPPLTDLKEMLSSD